MFMGPHKPPHGCNRDGSDALNGPSRPGLQVHDTWGHNGAGRFYNAEYNPSRCATGRWKGEGRGEERYTPSASLTSCAITTHSDDESTPASWTAASSGHSDARV